MAVFKGPRATRWDLVRDGALLALMREHEARCAYETLASLVAEIPQQGDRAVDRLLEILRFDAHIRPFTAGKLGLDPKQMDFLYGRPLTRTIEVFGLTVRREPDGTFLLTTVDDRERRSVK
ncbi:MAG: hypothetical protein JRJ35_04015 [Deltaproteobacteria bacterium]|nr:hypothetical protein [Deltaproteobacteria bacterium]MBW1949180.1 hypothetical protein [Deltaproteobacteria bacterium]MBW2007073.1 hypothetical protein [Deltaproteobacteria bacterium]